MTLSPEQRERYEETVSHAINARRAFESAEFKADCTPEQYAIAQQTMEYMDKAVQPFVRALEADGQGEQTT